MRSVCFELWCFLSLWLLSSVDMRTYFLDEKIRFMWCLLRTLYVSGLICGKHSNKHLHSMQAYDHVFLNNSILLLNDVGVFCGSLTLKWLYGHCLDHPPSLTLWRLVFCDNDHFFSTTCLLMLSAGSDLRSHSGVLPVAKELRSWFNYQRNDELLRTKRVPPCSYHSHFL